MAQGNWQTWLAPEIQELRGHLCAWPMSVTRGGRVSPLPGLAKLPDVGGKTFGSIMRLPPFLQGIAASTSHMVTT